MLSFGHLVVEKRDHSAGFSAQVTSAHLKLQQGNPSARVPNIEPDIFSELSKKVQEL